MAGRPKTTGRFATRAELVRRVYNFFVINKLSDEAIARNCKVSASTVANIIEEREWGTLEYPEDYAGCNPISGEFGVYMDEPFEVDVNLDAMSLRSCGSGYDFAIYPLHIPDRIKRELDLI